MDARKLIGKKIAKVHQYTHDHDGNKDRAIAAIEFTDGTFLRFSTLEGEGEYGTMGIYPAREPEGLKR